MKHVLSAAAVLGLVSGAICAGPANAGIITYSGTDSGAATSGPFPNSSAAQANFEAAASIYGPLHTITFEGLPTGDPHFLNAAPGVTIKWTDCNCGPGFAGINNTTFGNLYGFNVTPGGSQWLGFAAGAATFHFASGTNSFGFWATGLQTVFTPPGNLTVTFNDGTPEILTPTITANGGAEYFSFTDSTKFHSITISDPCSANGCDAWGIDDVTYNAQRAVPEPGSLLLIGSGLVALGARRRRKERKA